MDNFDLEENEEFYDKEKYYSQFGSVLNLFQFTFSEVPQSDYDFSRLVAIQALKSEKNRQSEFYKKRDRQNQNKKFLKLGYYGDNMHEELENAAPKGYKISLDTLLGGTYNLRFKELTHRSSKGLSYALLEPPYGLNFEEFISLEAREFGRKKIKSGERLRLIQTNLFNHFLDSIELEIDNEDQLIIFQWNNDWSEYFEMGKEWWGTYFWTILNKEKRKITVICASSTD